MIDNYEGERVSAEDQSVEELERIRTEICLELESKTRITPTRVLLDQLDEIDEELEYRARNEDRQEMADDDARAGLA